MIGASSAAQRTRGSAFDWIEVAATILLTFATVATAWSGYQATRWSGEQAKAVGRANATRIESTRAADLANAQKEVDVATFMQWIDAFATNETALADFYFARFREEFKPAVEAWIATRPLTNPDAPLTPFAMDEYKLAAEAEADRLQATADESADDAKEDIQRASNYVLGVVLFATALFFSGLSSRVTMRPVRMFVLALGCLVFLGTVVWLATFPVSISV